jgi:hypothetical protein
VFKVEIGREQLIAELSGFLIQFCESNRNAARQACCLFFMASATSSSCTSPVFGLGRSTLDVLPLGEGWERCRFGVAQREPRLPMVAL